MEKLSLQLQSTSKWLQSLSERNNQLTTEIYHVYKDKIDDILSNQNEYTQSEFYQIYKFVHEACNKINSINMDLEYDILLKEFPCYKEKIKNISRHKNLLNTSEDVIEKIEDEIITKGYEIQFETSKQQAKIVSQISEQNEIISGQIETVKVKDMHLKSPALPCNRRICANIFQNVNNENNVSTEQNNKSFDFELIDKPLATFTVDVKSTNNLKDTIDVKTSTVLDVIKQTNDSKKTEDIKKDSEVLVEHNEAILEVNEEIKSDLHLNLVPESMEECSNDTNSMKTFSNETESEADVPPPTHYLLKLCNNTKDFNEINNTNSGINDINNQTHTPNLINNTEILTSQSETQVKNTKEEIAAIDLSPEKSIPSSPNSGDSSQVKKYVPPFMRRRSQTPEEKINSEQFLPKQKHLTPTGLKPYADVLKAKPPQSAISVTHFPELKPAAVGSNIIKTHVEEYRNISSRKNSLSSVNSIDNIACTKVILNRPTEEQSLSNNNNNVVDVSNKFNLKTSDKVKSSINSVYLDYCDDLMPWEDECFEEAIPQGRTSDKIANVNIRSCRERKQAKEIANLIPDLKFRPSKENPFEEVKRINNVFPCRSDNSDDTLNVFTSTIGLSIKNRMFPPLLTKCYLTYISSPSQFYIQVLDEDYKALDKLMIELGNVYSKIPPQFKCKADAKKRIGSYCIVNINLFDFEWYRCKIMNWLKSDGEISTKVQVKLVDYGDTVEVDINQLRLIFPQHTNLPKFAIECHLANLYPPNSTKDHRYGPWPEEAIDEFKSISISPHEIIYFIIRFAQRIGHSFAIELQTENPNDPLIGEYMVRTGLAVEIIDSNNEIITNQFMIDQIKQAQGLSGLTKNMTSDEVVTEFLQNHRHEEAGDINEAVANYNPGDEARTCKFIRQGRSCYKGTLCMFDHTPLREDGFSNDTIEVYQSAFNEPILPELDEIIEITITAVKTVKSFYGQIISPEQTMEYNSLMDNMNSPSMIRSYEQLKIKPTIGQVIVVKYEDRWYRARVLDCFDPVHLPGTWLMVIIVDVGFEVEVPLTSARKIPKVFLELPFQAVFCTLNGITYNSGEPDDRAKEYFESRFLCQTFEAVVKRISPTGSLDVKLFNSQHKDIALELVEEGKAIPLMMGDIFPDSSQMLLVD